MKSFAEFLVVRDPEVFIEFVQYAETMINEAEEPAAIPFWRRWAKRAIPFVAGATAAITGAQASGATKQYSQPNQPVDDGKPQVTNVDDTVAAYNPVTGKFQTTPKSNAILSQGRWEIKGAGGGVDPLRQFEEPEKPGFDPLKQFAPDPDEGKGTVNPAVVDLVQMLGQNADDVVKTYYKTGSQYKGIVDKAVGVYLDKIENPEAKKIFATKMANHLLSNQVELSTSMVEKLIDAGLPAHFNDELLDRAKHPGWKGSYIHNSIIPKLAAKKVGDFVNKIGLLDKEGNIDQNQADEVASQLVKMYTQALPYDQDGEILNSMLPEIKKMSIFSNMAPQFAKYLTIEKGAVPESEWYRHAINAKQLAVLLKHNMVSPDSAAWFGKTHTYENLLSDNPEAAKKLYDLASKSGDFDWKKMVEPSGNPGLDSLHGFVNRGNPDARTVAGEEAEKMTQQAGEISKGLYKKAVDAFRKMFGREPKKLDRGDLERLMGILGKSSNTKN
jgi:hypothetical protein